MSCCNAASCMLQTEQCNSRGTIATCKYHLACGVLAQQPCLSFTSEDVLNQSCAFAAETLGIAHALESTAIDDRCREAGERSVVCGFLIKTYKSRWPLGVGDEKFLIGKGLVAGSSLDVAGVSCSLSATLTRDSVRYARVMLRRPTRGILGRGHANSALTRR